MCNEKDNDDQFSELHQCISNVIYDVILYLLKDINNRLALTYMNKEIFKFNNSDNSQYL